MEHASGLSRELMGRIRVPSGILLILDPGYLRFWSHTELPGPYFSDSGEARPQVDFEILGVDAERAGRQYDRQWNPQFLFDQPLDFQPKLEKHFSEFVASKNLNATLQVLPQSQMSHRERVDRALKYGRGAGEVQFHGLWSTAIEQLPPNALIEVYGERFLSGPDQGRWRRVVIECSNKAVARSEKAGMAMVDYARLLLADVDALGAWSDDSLDGKADVAFWGADADRTSDIVHADWLEDNTHGWADLTLEEAEARLQRLEELKESEKLKICVDYRPHSHHFLLMKQVRSSATESGEVAVANAQFCGFSTTWGDGIFTIVRDLAEDGSLVRIRVDVGSDEIVARQRKFDEWWTGDFSKFALVSNRVWNEGLPVRWMYRLPAERDQHSGWCVFAGDEEQEYNDDSNNISLVRLRDLIARDETLEAVLRSDPPCAFERKDVETPFVAVEPPEEED